MAAGMAAAATKAINPALVMGGMQAGAGLGSMFAPWENPADSAIPYLQQIPSTIGPYYEPWMQGGQQGFEQYQQQANKLTSNPGGFVNEVGQGYQQSPGMDFQMQQALQAGNNAAAAGGYAGTPQHQQYSMQTANDIASQDYYKYLASALGMYGQGFQGLGDVSRMGLGATNEMTQAIMDALTMQAKLEYEGQQAENQHSGGGLGSLIGGVGSAIGGLF